MSRAHRGRVRVWCSWCHVGVTEERASPVAGMGLYLEEACKLEWRSETRGRKRMLIAKRLRVFGRGGLETRPYSSARSFRCSLLGPQYVAFFLIHEYSGRAIIERSRFRTKKEGIWQLLRVSPVFLSSCFLDQCLRPLPHTCCGESPCSAIVFLHP